MKMLEIDLPVPDHTTLSNGGIVAFDLTDKDVDDTSQSPRYWIN